MLKGDQKGALSICVQENHHLHKWKDVSAGPEKGTLKSLIFLHIK